MWQLPGNRLYFKTKPGQYISHLMGHEGKNSLLSLLKEKTYVYELVAGSGYDHADFSLIYVDIEVTEMGWENWEEIVELCFVFIEMLREKGV